MSGGNSIVSKSPLTGAYGEAEITGSWGYELKRAGFDGMVVEGKARNPVYIRINNREVTIVDAGHLWGLDAYTLDECIKQEFPDFQIMGIGPAGEELVRFASIVTEGRNARVSSRGGMGAVMGSKMLKAIVVKGTLNVHEFNKGKMAEDPVIVANLIKEGAVSLSKYGTSGEVIGNESCGDFPLRNWTQARWQEGADKISGEKMVESILVKNYYCKMCVVGCGRVVKINDGKYKDVDGAGPEYETIGALGGLCLVDDLEAIAFANQLCNQYGIDTVSTGGVVAMVMEMYEKGLINNKDTNGVKAQFGDAEAMIKLIRMIGEREGLFGWLMGEGVKKISEKIGGLAYEYALHVKGMEIPAHDPRVYNGVALSYATANQGACHMAGFTVPFEKDHGIPELGYYVAHGRIAQEGKGKFVAKLQDLMGVLDSLNICKFALLGGLKIMTIVKWINDVIGWEDYSFKEMIKTGERIYNIKRMFNVKCGMSRKDDTLPNRFLTLKRIGPGITVNLPYLGSMLNEYYEHRGWTEEGVPSEEKLKELDIT
jgi:aldehyde:ferredoxin oxidoreductase